MKERHFIPGYLHTETHTPAHIHTTAMQCLPTGVILQPVKRVVRIRHYKTPLMGLKFSPATHTTLLFSQGRVAMTFTAQWQALPHTMHPATHPLYLPNSVMTFP